MVLTHNTCCTKENLKGNQHHVVVDMNGDSGFKIWLKYVLFFLEVAACSFCS
jgi:hypothetical protein